MVTTPAGHVVPGPYDAPRRAAFDNLANSINDVLTFESLAVANSFATTHPAIASPGKLASINGRLHVMNGTAWVGVPMFIQAATAAAAPGLSAGDPSNVYWVGV